ncbi:acetate--CoA ligase [Pelagicoccus sp. SDUM812003]|uniref:acetate--CoA ligase n=1 Tax=Pelagicoccus sp. SDUM812003 TaxID=3041267 RepID=UPI00280E9065|nr:acetate--CoA ligase [Pelagicoccus sp. SDUM812003]MDQ8203714.1 acetate--CoA ligase [Pelagicoccus sp. SDUM812003]
MAEKITSTSKDGERIAPSSEFKKQATISSLAEYKRLYSESVNAPEKFWNTQAKELLKWRKPWRKTLEWKEPHAKWFVGGKLNVCENCVDRHLGTPRENKAALIFEGETGDQKTLTYKQLHVEVCKFANVLTGLGVKKGDRIAIYMPMNCEAVVAMLASARIGAVHTVIFGGFSSESIKDRVNDCQAKVIVTADGGWRRGSVVELKKNVDDAVKGCPSITNVVVVKHIGHRVSMKVGRDVWYHTLMNDASHKHAAKAFDSETPLFVLYTSGSTGKPKGVLHTSGGYLLGTTMTSKYVFDLKETDTYWCTADIGWITGHSYVTYGILSNGATNVIYEGAPNYPEVDRFWDIVERHRVTIFYTAPTAIRAFMKWGDEPIKKHDLSSLRLLGTVGEPINPEAWRWYYKTIGGERCPIVDTWWQTETGGIMITTLPGAAPSKPGSAGLPFFGVVPKVFDDAGNEVKKGENGKLVLTTPWPSMLRTLYGDNKRYKKVYWSEYKGVYFCGDGCKQDKDGYFWIIGRIDDVLNVSGHRIGTAEVESALVSHPSVAEAAVVGRPHDIKGNAIVCFVTLKQGLEGTDELRRELRDHVGHEIGAHSKPDEIRFAAALPKTRSGKIMRRLLKDIAVGKEIKQDTTTLEDLSVVKQLQAQD